MPITPELAYQMSFAHYPSEVAYVDLWKKIDNRGLIAERLEKALSLAGTGSNLVPVYVDPQVIDLTRKATPLVELLPRVANRGKSADFNRITSLGSVGFKGEDAALADADDKYERKSTGVRYLYGVGRVTGQLLAAAAEYIDAMNQEVLMKTKQLRYIEEHAILNCADSAASSTGATQAAVSPFNGQGYDGLIMQQYGGTLGGVLYTSDSNVTNNGTEALDIATTRSVITAARNYGGEPKIVVTDWAGVDILKGLLMEFQRYVDTTRLAWGIETLSFDGIPVIGSRFLADRGIGFGQTAGTYLTPNAKRWALFLDTDVLEMRVLQDVVFERMAKVSDADKFMLKLYEVVVNKAPEFNSAIFDFS